MEGKPYHAIERLGSASSWYDLCLPKNSTIWKFFARGMNSVSEVFAKHGSIKILRFICFRLEDLI